MPGGMPYQLEKGPYFAVTESMLDFGGSQPQRLQLLRLMLAGTDPGQLPPLNSTSLDKGPLTDADARRDHMNTHWFGKSRTSQTAPWNPQPAFDPSHPRPTGYWRNWYGDADGIVAQAFIRAVEVSLGLDHVAAGTDVATLQPTRFWPIEIFWRCPAPWFEGWVTWRRETGGSGHVTVHLHTPAHTASALLLSPIRQAPANTYPDYEQDPKKSDRGRGMWVITHEKQDPLPFSSVTNPSPPGQWPLPTLAPLPFAPFYYSHGPIVTVQPNEADGGVLGTGRAYVPPPPPAGP